MTDEEARRERRIIAITRAMSGEGYIKRLIDTHDDGQARGEYSRLIDSMASVIVYKDELLEAIKLWADAQDIESGEAFAAANLRKTAGMLMKKFEESDESA